MKLSFQLKKNSNFPANEKVVKMANTLLMSFDPSTIEHLGVKMYSKLPNAIAELIANAYDADSSKVKICLYDKGKREIVIKDNGIGMSFDEINNYFLRIGRNRRKEGQEKSLSGKRKATGKKGLGKLAFFGIGNTIEIETIRKGLGEKIIFKLDWNELINTTDRDYKPTYKKYKCKRSLQGTKVTLKNLKRKTQFDKASLANSISKLFNFFDFSFKVTINQNNDSPLLIDDKLKFQNIKPEFEWSYKDLVSNFYVNYTNRKKISGKIISTSKPLNPDLRGITLYANGRLINAPEFFGISESSHGYSYFTGWLIVDFVDDWKEDVISTHRQAINWDLPDTIILREYLKKLMAHLEREWRIKRKEERDKELSKKTKINIKNWFDSLPKDIRKRVEPIINVIEDKSELPEIDRTVTIKHIHELIPEYPYYHWRHLHKSIHEVAEKDYKEFDYLRAADESIKKYIKDVQKKAKSKNKNGKLRDGVDLMFNAFGEKGVLKFTSCKTETEINLENGQQHISAGAVVGFRNPVSHETKEFLYPKIFNDKDCLDILSMISYLFGKLDKTKKKP